LKRSTAGLTGCYACDSGQPSLPCWRSRTGLEGPG